MAQPRLSRKCIVCGVISYCTFPDSGCVSAIWLLNQVAPSRTTNFSEQEKLTLAELGRDFPEVESKGYESKTLAKKTKAWEEILTKFNSQNLNGIKSDLSQLQGCWRQLKLNLVPRVFSLSNMAAAREKTSSSLLPPPYWKARRPSGRGWLKLQSKKEHDLHRREARKTGMHQVELFSSASFVQQKELYEPERDAV